MRRNANRHNKFTVVTEIAQPRMVMLQTFCCMTDPSEAKSLLVMNR